MIRLMVAACLGWLLTTGVQAASLLETVAEDVNWVQPNPLFDGVSLGDPVDSVEQRLGCSRISRGHNADGSRVTCLLQGAPDDAGREYEALNVQADSAGTTIEVVSLRLYPTQLTPDAIGAIRADYTERFGPPTLVQWADAEVEIDGVTALRQLCWGRQCRCAPARCDYIDESSGEVSGKALEFSTWDPRGDAALLTLRNSPFVTGNDGSRWADSVTVLVRRLGPPPQP